MFSSIQPHAFVALRLPHGLHRVIKLVPDTTISLGKYGTFNTNLLFGRPYYFTFEILDKTDEQAFAELRVVPPSEIHAEALAENEPTPIESRDEIAGEAEDNVQFDLVGDNGELIVRNNRLTVDDPSRQALTMEEIEELKKASSSGAGKEIIAKIMQSHSALDEKTAFSLAKYTLRKSKKYMRRFTVLPLDISVLTRWMLHEKDPVRIIELREEVLGLMMAWSNVHCGANPYPSPEGGIEPSAHHRWLAVDDTSGLVVAALAEKMGILYPDCPVEDVDKEETSLHDDVKESEILPSLDEDRGSDVPKTFISDESSSPNNARMNPRPQHRVRRHPLDAMSASSNTITVIHSASQPNLSILNYFSYDSNEIGSTSNPLVTGDHPLHAHLKTLSWLQLLSPHLDTAYLEPPFVSDSILATWKPGKRGAYYRKRRRWERAKRVIDETRAGDFNGLVVASVTAPETILHNTVPLLRGGAQVVVYSPTIEPLLELMDLYSTGRKTAFISATCSDPDAEQSFVPSSDFPLDPRLLLGASLQTVRTREWQVLPGRTHPVMTSRGGPEGYIFTATRVIPVEGKVEARGRFTKKRKIDVLATEDADGVITASSEEIVS